MKGEGSVFTADSGTGQDVAAPETSLLWSNGLITFSSVLIRKHLTLRRKV